MSSLRAMTDRPPRRSVALIGSGATALRALHRLRAAGTSVRWFTDDLDVGEELLLASIPPGGVEISVADPLTADFSEFAAVVPASQTALDQHIARRAGAKTVSADNIDRIAHAFANGDRDTGRAITEDIAA